MIFDLSPPISDRLKVWPGDTPPRREVLLDLDRGDNLTLSTLHATVHLGSHVDGPNHYGRGSGGVDSWPIDRFVGPCQVVRVSVEPGALVRVEHLQGTTVDAPRLLIATGSFPDPESFREDFNALDPELVSFLHDRGVRLIGVDTPSVDPFSSKELPAHHRFLDLGVTILEGLVLAKVPEGRYELIALPLLLVGFDASPVRAILRTVPT
ncbi:cyclase family protein [Tautonia rosea]|uniref:cyclase family protein n=1 Tax=Tautonia rosea TaxID=2728037 RepID=UPI00147672BC|nr:cyclase family protein [Tautonia rosea]